jgi:hypothetical protein
MAGFDSHDRIEAGIVGRIAVVDFDGDGVFLDRRRLAGGCLFYDEAQEAAEPVRGGELGAGQNPIELGGYRSHRRVLIILDQRATYG